MGARQLPLLLETSASYKEADFYQTAGSQLARDLLEQPALWSHGRLLLWGEAGTGKTHLLHIWASANRALFVSGPALRELLPAISCPVVIDDSDRAGEADLLHLLNMIAEARQPALLAARQPPSRQPTALPDLASRLRASMAVEITAPTDPERAGLLSRLAANRQLVLSAQVQNYLLSHLPRTPEALIEAVTRLDRAALANGSKISRQLAAELIIDIASTDQTGSQMLSNGHS